MINLRNPYIPLHVDNPTLAQDLQKTLAGEGMKEKREVCQAALASWTRLLEGSAGEEDWGRMERMMEMVTGNILQERLRIGGDWAIAGALTHRRLRDCVRDRLGPDLQIVVLAMAEDTVRERLEARHRAQPSVVEFLTVIWAKIFQFSLSPSDGGEDVSHC